MKLILDGKINKTYVQTLCMAFFHGEKFPEDEKDVTSVLYVRTEDRECGICCEAELCTPYGKEHATSFVPFSCSKSYERISKTAVGKAVYEVASKLTGRSLPWGILTGIRPSKVAADLIKAEGEERASSMLKNEYLLSDKKIHLVTDVAKNEKKIISLAKDKTCSVYISIPFCPSRCNYCSFISYATPKLFSLIPEYLNRLMFDIKDTFKTIKSLGLKVLCVYIGGGTPTILDENQLDKLLSCIENCIDTKELPEFTLEGGRPDTITVEKLRIAKSHGVNRISVNPQSLNDLVLEKIGRKHTVSDFLRAYETVEKSGIEHINTDLIAGLDGDTKESFQNTVDKIISLSPGNVTVHTLCVKNAAEIRKGERNIYQASGDIAGASVDYAYDRLTDSGYAPYYLYRQKNTVSDLENVGYSKPGEEGLYNVFMMADAHSVFGVGAGSTTKLVSAKDGKTQIKRIFSPKYPYEYLQDNRKVCKETEDFKKEAEK